jgi:hypothetical protein
VEAEAVAKYCRTSVPNTHLLPSMQNETARYCGPQVPTNFCEYSFQGALDEFWSCSSGESAEIECKEALGHAACASLLLVVPSLQQPSSGRDTIILLNYRCFCLSNLLQSILRSSLEIMRGLQVHCEIDWMRSS